MSNQKQGSNFVQRLGMLACTVVVILVLAGALAYGLYRVVLANTTHGAVVVWALLATALLPVAGWVGASWGPRGARGLVEGLHTGVDAVMDAANETANLKVNVHRVVHAPAAQPQAVLPQVIDITPRQLTGGRDIIV